VYLLDNRCFFVVEAVDWMLSRVVAVGWMLFGAEVVMWMLW